LELTIGWFALRNIAKQTTDDELLSFADSLTDKARFAPHREMWGKTVTREAVTVSNTRIISLQFRKAYLARAPYVFVFGVGSSKRIGVVEPTPTTGSQQSASVDPEQ